MQAKIKTFTARLLTIYTHLSVFFTHLLTSIIVFGQSEYKKRGRPVRVCPVKGFRLSNGLSGDHHAFCFFKLTRFQRIEIDT